MYLSDLVIIFNNLRIKTSQMYSIYYNLVSDFYYWKQINYIGRYNNIWSKNYFLGRLYSGGRVSR